MLASPVAAPERDLHVTPPPHRTIQIGLERRSTRARHLRALDDAHAKLPVERRHETHEQSANR
jgi:hypothetical protein